MEIKVRYVESEGMALSDEVFLGRSMLGHLLNRQREAAGAGPVSLVRVAMDLLESGRVIRVAVQDLADPEISAATACLKGSLIPGELAEYLAQFSAGETDCMKRDPEYRIIEAFREYVRGIDTPEELACRGGEFWDEVLPDEKWIASLSQDYRLKELKDSIQLELAQVAENGTALIVCRGYGYPYGFQILGSDVVIEGRHRSKVLMDFSIGKVDKEVPVDLGWIAERINRVEDRKREEFNATLEASLLKATEGEDSWRLAPEDNLYMLGPLMGSLIPAQDLLLFVDVLRKPAAGSG